MFALDPSSRQHGRDPNEPFFRELFERLDRMGKKQLLVCPSSEFHDLESLPTPCFEQLKRMYELLAYSVRWFDSDQVRMMLIMEAFRGWLSGSSPQESSYTRDDFLYGDRTGWTGHFYAESHLRRGLNLVEEIRRVRGDTLNELRVVFEQWQTDKDKGFDFWLLEEKRASARKYIRGLEHQVQELLVAEEEIRRTQTVSLEAAAAFFAPSHESKVLMHIRDGLSKAGFEADQWTTTACDFLQSEHFMGLSFVRIGAMIWATVAHRAAHGGRKRCPDKGFYNDVSVIETYLPYCDAMFLDKECHDILDDRLMRPVLDQYGTRIYSVRNKQAFVDYLDGIESGASPEHIDRLKEVYGDRYLRPYVGLYED